MLIPLSLGVTLGVSPPVISFNGCLNQIIRFTKDGTSIISDSGSPCSLQLLVLYEFKYSPIFFKNFGHFIVGAGRNVVHLHSD